jgi:hypothetical protein
MFHWYFGALTPIGDGQSLVLAIAKFAYRRGMGAAQRRGITSRDQALHSGEARGGGMGGFAGTLLKWPRFTRAGR